MGTLCCTTRYRRLFALPANLPSASAGSGALCPWYANVLNIGHNRLLHYMSSTSLLSVIIWQRERRSAEQRFVSALAELLAALHVPDAFVAAELGELTSFEYTRATDRSVLGSMRDQAHLARYSLDDSATLLDLALRLAETPCGPLDYESPDRVTPRLIRERWSGPRGRA
jgi:hypothetical protein